MPTCAFLSEPQSAVMKKKLAPETAALIEGFPKPRRSAHLASPPTHRPRSPIKLLTPILLASKTTTTVSFGVAVRSAACRKNMQADQTSPVRILRSGPAFQRETASPVLPSMVLMQELIRIVAGIW